MNEGRLQMRLVFELLFLWVTLLGYLLLEAVIHLVLGLMWGSCRSQRLGLHSLCIRSFSIIGDL